MTSRARRLLQTGSLAVRPFPTSLLRRAGTAAGLAVATARPGMGETLEENLAHVRPRASADELRSMARSGVGSYGRYWVETLKLPTLSAKEIDDGFGVDGYEHIQAARRAGYGPIMVLPHLGGWEWAAAWLGRVAEIPVTAVVEPLEPPDVFEWFRDLRSSYGINVVPLGPNALGPVVKAVKDRHVVCLLADRDLTDSGIEVEFFGASTTMPVGPALVARRTGAPLLPTAVYFEGGQRICRIRPPVAVDRTKSLRADLAATTQRLANELEVLIEAAPDQWHVLQPVFGGSNEVSPS